MKIRSSAVRLAVAGALLVAALPALAAADASPSPAPSASAKVKAAAPNRYSTNLCNQAILYIWPAVGQLPQPSNLRRANVGERFEIRSGPRYSLENEGYYETSIPVFETIVSGAQQFYWVSIKCFTVPAAEGSR